MKKKDFFRPIVGMTKDEILTKISREVKMSTDFVSTKRQTFRDRLKLYNNQRKQREKIGILTIYTTINTLLAVHYTDEMTVEFAPREFGDSKLKDNINATAKFDFEEMGMDQINYLKEWDRFFYGVGLRDISTFNTTTNTPIAKSLSPMGWLPDPRGGFTTDGVGGFRFYGFEVERSLAEMEGNKAFFNLDVLKDTISQPTADQLATRDDENEAHGLGNTPQEEYGSSDVKYMIDFYTYLKNENGGRSKYLVTVNTSCTEIFRLEKIGPVTEEEKEDESLVPWPLVPNYYSPIRNDPFGVSVCDLVEDKQRAKSVLANLRISKEKAALYPMYIYNTQSIRNRRDLDFGFNKAIAVNIPKGGSLTDVLMPIRKDQNTSSTLSQEQTLDAEAQISTGADQMQSGVLSSKSRTLGEVEQVTLNAQTRFLLGYRINAWGEKTFWRLWYRMYRKYYSKTQKKIIRLQGGFSTKYTTITRKDFITVSDPDVFIISKQELAMKKDRERLIFAQLAPMILQDPTKPLASRNFTQRHLLRLNDVEPDVISILCPPNPDEMTAELENELLSRNMSATLMMTDDHLSHMVIHSFAEDTNEKFAHIEAHKQAYILSGQKAKMDDMAAQMSTSMRPIANQMNNQISNQASQQLGGSESGPIVNTVNQ